MLIPEPFPIQYYSQLSPFPPLHPKHASAQDSRADDKVGGLLEHYPCLAHQAAQALQGPWPQVGKFGQDSLFL